MRRIHSLWQRLIGLFTRENIETRIDQELESHVAMHTEDNVRSGMSTEEARRQALIKLGGMAQSQELYRDRSRLRVIDTLAQDIRYALRILRKNPGFTVVAVLTLALGIGANTAIFSVVNGVLLRPLPYENPGRLISIYDTAPSRGLQVFGASPPDFRKLRAENHTFTSLSAYASGVFNLTGTGEAERVQVEAVSPEYFTTLGLKPILGREFLPREEQWGSQHVVILSHGFWHTRFNDDRNISGKTLKLDGDVYNVIGVMPAGFFTQSQAQIWVPMAFAPKDPMDSHNNFFMNMVGRLKPGVTRQQAFSDLNSIMLGIVQQSPENKGISVDLRSFRDTWVGDARPALLVLLGAVGLVLLIACGNLANLMLARTGARRKEIAIRAALGASRPRLLRQFLTESVLLSLLGGMLGLALAYFSLDLLPLAKNILPRMNEVHLDGWVLLFTFMVSGLTGILFGLLPGTQSSRTQALNDSLKKGGRVPAAESGGMGFRRGVIVSEVALALVLLIGSGLAIKSFQRLIHVDAGFASDHVLTFQVNIPQSYDPQPDPLRFGAPPRVAAFFREFIDRLEQIPGVKAAGTISTLPLQGETWSKFFVPLDRPLPTSIDKVPNVQYRSVAGHYFNTLGIRLLKGRLLDEHDQAGNPFVVVINETLARQFWQGQEPLGKTVLLTPPESLIPADQIPPGFHVPKLTVVGVVSDAHYGGLDQDPAPVVYGSVFQQDYSSGPSFIVRTVGDPEGLIFSIRKELAQIDKDMPIAKVVTMDELKADSVAQPRLEAILLGSFGGLALLLAAVGIYGVMSYTASQRTSEIGIRMALGASRWNVLTMVCGQGLILTTIGLAAGVGLAIALTRLMSKILFGVSPTDPLTFAAVVVVLALVAFLACYFPARRATRVDPMIALRYE